MLMNPEKAERALNGTVGAQGALVGGVGADAEEGAILAEYDRLGGLITLEGNKVKTGSFYDFAGKKPHKKPQVMLVFQIEGETIEVSPDEPLPLEVRAAKAAKAKKAAAKAQKAQEAADKKAAGKKGKKGKKANAAADEEDEAEEATEEDAKGDEEDAGLA